jgi:hypothetical protein
MKKVCAIMVMFVVMSVSVSMAETNSTSDGKDVDEIPVLVTDGDVE